MLMLKRVGLVIAFLVLPQIVNAAEAPKPPVQIEIAKDPSKLSVGQVIQISVALSKMNCGDKILKDGSKESIACVPYEWSPGLSWMISGNLHKSQEVALRYYKLRNEALAALPRKADGTIASDVDAKFGQYDSGMQDQDSGVTLEHFRRSDLEPMKLPPSVLAGLWPIID